ncbi:MAG: hypothetical protein Q9176_005134 [Flavoplaca citrina]
MKYINIVSPLALVFVALSSCITANPVTSSADEGLAKNNLQARQEQGEEWNFPDPPVTLPPVRIEDILNLASNLFAVQLVGAYPRGDQLNQLCFNFDQTRLSAQGYNTTILHNIFCEAGWATFLGTSTYDVPTSDYIKNLVTKFSTNIWIFQAFGAMNNDPYRLGKLCELLTPEFSFKVGLDFDLVKKSVCEGGEGKALPDVLEFAVPFEDLRKMRAGMGRPGMGRRARVLSWGLRGGSLRL